MHGDEHGLRITKPERCLELALSFYIGLDNRYLYPKV